MAKQEKYYFYTIIAIIAVVAVMILAIHHLFLLKCFVIPAIKSWSWAVKHTPALMAAQWVRACQLLLAQTLIMEKTIM
jgi:hypothetical protein